MNILFLVDRYPPDRFGGVWETALRLRCALESAGHRVFVLTTGAPTKDTPDIVCGTEAGQSAVIFRTGTRFGPALARMIPQTLRIVREHKIDLIHAHQPAAAPVLLARKFRALRSFPPVVSSFQVTYFAEFRAAHGVTIGGRRFRLTPAELLQKYLYAPCHVVADAFAFHCADRVTAVSTELARELEGSYGRFFGRKVQVVPNGAPETESQTRTEVEPVPAPEKHRRILFAGAFRSRKGLWHLLSAFSQIVKEHPHTRLTLAGSGRGYERRLIEECERLGITANVEFAGALPHAAVVEAMRRTDIFCLPSRMEGLPLALLEAMALGLCVVTTKVSGMRDLIADGKNGLLVPPDDVKALAEALSSALQNPALRASLGSGAQATVRGAYRWERIAAQFEEIYGECVRSG